MLLTTLRRLRRSEEGQSVVVGAVSILILALAVCMTLQIGYGVHQKIQVQNAADNHAFTQAAVAARTLNFIAWVNRTQVLHYVGAMATHAIPSIFTGLHAAAGIARDIVYTLTAMVCVALRLAQICCAIPYTAVVCCPLQEALEILYDALQEVLPVADELVDGAKELMDAMDQISRLVPLFQNLNQYLMFWASRIVKTATIAVLGADAGSGVLPLGDSVSDRAAKLTGSRRDTPLVEPMSLVGNAGAIYAAAEFKAMFGDDPPPENFSGTATETDNDAQRRAMRIITEISNATRAGNSATNTPLTHRRLGGDGFFGAVAEFIGPKWDGQTKLMYPYTKNTFREESGTMSMPSTGLGSSRCQSSSDRAQRSATDCNQADATLSQRQRDCSQRQSECSSQPDPTSCAASVCDQVPPAQSDRDTKCDRARSDSQQAQRDCDMNVDSGSVSSGGIGSSGGGSFSSQCSAGGKNRNCIWTTAYKYSQMATGVSMDSAERIEVAGIGGTLLALGANMKVVGIQATDVSENDGAYHCKYDTFQEIPVPSCTAAHRPKPIVCDDDGLHSWPGMANYVNFKPDPSPSEEFNQGKMFSAWSMNMQNASFPMDLPFGLGNVQGDYQTMTDYKNWSDGSGGKIEKGLIGEPGMLGSGNYQGINSVSAAQVYYHRPNNWSEHPNCFNPYWKARLIPASRVIADMPAGIGTMLNNAQSLLGSVPGMPELLLMH